MDYREMYQAWLNNEDFDEAFRTELRQLTDEKEIEDRFYKDLSFGTAGMRGVIGAGRNRINIYTIRKATQGYANFLKSKSQSASCVIAYDNRRQSVQFAEEAAAVFAGNGIKTYVFDNLRSTPQLSFAIRHLATTGGVVITASHNPPEYNGYKVYGSDGAQLMPAEAAKVTDYVEAISDFSEVDRLPFGTAREQGLVEIIGEAVDRAYLQAVKQQIIRPDSYQIALNIAYSPLHGTGGMIIKQLFDDLHVEDIYYEPDQMIADSEFSTVKQPNPESLQAFERLERYGAAQRAALLIATDPDADRVGVMVRDQQGNYIKLSGNQLGALLTHYVLSSKSDLPAGARIVKTVVTSDMGPQIAQKYGVAYDETLTGFKFIGDKIESYLAAGDKSFILGYEESYGYLVGTHARDKDAVVTVMLVVEMAKFYHSQNLNLLQVLESLYREFGYYKDAMSAKLMKGKSGMKMIEKILSGFRSNATDRLKTLDIIRVDDFQSGESLDTKTGQRKALNQPTSNVLKYYIEPHSWFAVRPSGTEPKIKFYISVVARDEAGADQKLQRISQAIDDYIDTVAGRAIDL